MTLKTTAHTTFQISEVDHTYQANLLGRAFGRDPMMTFLFPDEAHRTRKLPHFLGGIVRLCRLYGEVHTTPDHTGVACWLPPGQRVTFWRLVRTGNLAAPLQLGLAGFRRLLALQAHFEREHVRRAPEPHWYLYLLGVDPAGQGRGVARTLLAPVLGRADAQGVACYLETQNEHNVAVYQRFGFQVTSAEVVPGYDLRVWTMRREPRIP